MNSTNAQTARKKEETTDENLLDFIIETSIDVLASFPAKAVETTVAIGTGLGEFGSGAAGATGDFLESVVEGIADGL